MITESQLKRKTLKELKQLCKEKGLYFLGLGYRPKADYIDALIGRENFSVSKEVYEKWKNEPGVANPARREEDEYDVKPFAPGSFLRKVELGKNASKYEIRGLHGARNSLKRFINIPFYIVKHSDKVEGFAFNLKEEAEWWKNKFGGEVAEVILTKDQIL